MCLAEPNRSRTFVLFKQTPEHMMNNYLLVGVLATAMLATDASGQVALTPGMTSKNTLRAAEKGAPVARVRRVGLRPEARGTIANDACADAIALTVNDPADCPGNATAGDNTGATSTDGDPTCDGGGSAYEDVWYSFNSGSFTNVVINITAGTISDIVVDVLEGGCGGTSVACDIGNTEVSVLVTPNTDYVFSVVSNNDFGLGGTFDVCLTGLGGGSAPANDECNGATTLEVATECTPVTASLADATSSSPAIACNGFTSPGSLDVWFSFVASGPVTSVQVDGQGTMDAVMEGFSGSCGNLVSVGCADATFPPNSLQETLTLNTMAGTTYYVRVYHYGAAPTSNPEFSICAFSPSNVPANDQCTGATPEPLAVGGTLTWTGDNTGALDTEGLGNPSVWHAFTTTECTNIVIDYCGMATPFGNVGARLYIDCPFTDFVQFSNGNFDDCGDGNATIYFNGVAAGTYYYAVLGGANATGAYGINVSASPCSPAPSNDECAGAQSLNVSPTCNPTPGTTTGATQSLDPIACNGFTSSNALDVWYSFVATTTDHTITVEGIEEFDGVLEFFSGDCSNLVSVSCTDDTFPNPDPVNEVMVQSGLTVGSTYYVRVYDYAHASANHLFNICVTGDIGTEVDALNANSTFTVFPNPSNGDITISSRDLSGASVIEVMDMTGRVLHSENRTLAVGQAHQLNLAGRIASGSYIVRVLTTEGSSEQRVVIR